MFKQDLDFGFEIDTSLRRKEDVEDAEYARQSAIFLDFKDGEDLENEALESGVSAIPGSIPKLIPGPIPGPPGSITGPPAGLALDSIESINHGMASMNLQGAKIIRPLPILETASLDFEQNLLAFVGDLRKTEVSEEVGEMHDSLYDLALRASPELIKLLLESVANPAQVAEAIQRLRIIVGVSPLDNNLSYQYYYIFSCCNDEVFDQSNDWENIIALTMKEIVDEIFTGSIYLLGDHEINVVLLPTDLTEAEKEVIRANRIWGVRMKENLLGDLDEYLKVDPDLSDKGQELQLRIMGQFMREIAPRFPDLSNYKLGNMLDESSYVARFNWIRERIDEFFLTALDEELEREAELVGRFIKPIIE